MIKVGIVGGGGYTAGELIRILSAHPEVEIFFIFSESQAGKKVSKVHRDLLYLDLTFTSQIKQADILFLCQGHGKAISFMELYKVSMEVMVIDLGNDFRIDNQEWTYGLPELYRDRIKKSKRIANPGCFATAIQLALLPLAKHKMLKNDIHVSAVTGSTGAGQRLQDTTHFTWRQNNFSVYKAFNHQHEAEIYQSIEALQANANIEINFLPHRGDYTRGIYASIYTEVDVSLENLFNLFHEYYAEHPYVTVTTDEISLKQVVNTNHCFLQISKHKGKILVHSIIDNLVKGASGQAVQNMNIAFGFPEQTGLQLKPSAY